jgi:iron complex transport system substrate-binding protein
MIKGSRITSRQIFIILLVFFPVSCHDNSEKSHKIRNDNPEVTHAMGFTVEENDSYHILKVYNPWQGARDVLFSYILADYNSELPESLPEGNLIRTPVRSVICLSTTHVAMLDFIDETAKIKAVSGSDYIFNTDIRDRVEKGELPDIGYDMNLDYERILELNPDIILAYGVGAEASAWLNRLNNLGMKVVMTGEYLEGSPLAQAEWVKFIAHLFQKQDIAADKFNKVKKEYLELIELTTGTETFPVIMSGLPWRDSWFVPGGRSHFATLIGDAGGKYLWGGDLGRENFPVDIETVIERGSTADYWINIGTALSKKDIENTDSRLVTLRPFRIGNLYNNNARLNRFGGNDYWESGIMNPHLILRDIIHIIHPDLLPEHEPVYYRQL